MTFQRTPAWADRLKAVLATTGCALLATLGCAETLSRSTAPNANLACHNLRDAAISPISQYASDASVTVISADDLPGVSDEWEPNRIAGVRASVPAPSGWSRTFLERRIGCYRATSAKRSASDVLLVDGSTIRVDEALGRFEITVYSDDPAVVARIVDSVQGASQAPNPASALQPSVLQPSVL
jgi:hypothetical protein